MYRNGTERCGGWERAAERYMKLSVSRPVKTGTQSLRYGCNERRVSRNLGGNTVHSSLDFIGGLYFFIGGFYLCSGHPSTI